MKKYFIYNKIRGITGKKLRQIGVTFGAAWSLSRQQMPVMLGF